MSRVLSPFDWDPRIEMRVEYHKAELSRRRSATEAADDRIGNRVVTPKQYGALCAGDCRNGLLDRTVGRLKGVVGIDLAKVTKDYPVERYSLITTIK